MKEEQDVSLASCKILEGKGQETDTEEQKQNHWKTSEHVRDT